jgi:hypothetical protein
MTRVKVITDKVITKDAFYTKLARHQRRGIGQ